MKRIRFAVHPAFLPVMIIGFFTGTIFRMLAVYLCLLIHEAGHMTAALGFKVRVLYIKIMPFGIAMKLSDRDLSFKKQFTISLAGPVFSIIAGILSDNEFLKFTNITLGIFNLFPVKTLDGGKLFYIVSSQIFGSITAYNIIKKLSAIFSVLLLSMGIYAFFITGYNISIALVAVFLIYSLYSGDEYSRLYACLNSLDYKKKSRGIFKTKHLAISAQTPLRKVLSEIPSGRLCIINILDDKNRIISTITESEAVDIMLKYGASANFASAQKEKIYEFGQNT